MAKPVALYYGMISFAAAAVLSRGRSERLAQIRPGHGLTTNMKNLSSVESAAVSSEKSDDFLFHRFTRLLLNSVGTLGRTNLRPLSLFDEWRVSRLENVSLQELLARIPHMMDLHAQTFSVPPPIARVEILDLRLVPPKPRLVASLRFAHTPQGGTNQQELDAKRERIEWLRRELPPLDQWRFCRFDPGAIVFDHVDSKRSGNLEDELLTKLAKPLSGLLPLLGRGPLGGWFVTAPLLGHANALPQAALMMAAAHLLSNIARYRADLWMNFLSGRNDHDSRLRALVEEFFVVCETQFPLEALGLLTGRPIEVRSGQAAVWG